MGSEMTATADDILQIGDPRLRAPADLVSDPRDAATLANARRVEDALQGFREEHGFGRGTAATQLGIEQRIIALHMTDWPGAIFNPKITWRSPDSMTLWENCMSFPFMLVRTRRAASISVEFQDANGAAHHRERLDAEISELLQHEIDHLDGILAVDRAIDRDSMLSRKTFDADREYFLGLVDYRRNNEQKLV
jgi:peptide deformylase